MDVNTQACDVCGKLKEKSNNWFALSIGSGSFTIYLWEFRPKDKHMHLCGPAHLIEKISQLLTQTKGESNETV